MGNTMAVQRWPHNTHLLADKDGFPVDLGVKWRVFEWFAEDPHDSLANQVLTVTWPADGTSYELPPLMTIEQVAEQSAPWDAMVCDRCQSRGDYPDDGIHVQSILLVPYAAFLVGLVLCPGCSYELGADPHNRLIYRREKAT